MNITREDLERLQYLNKQIKTYKEKKADLESHARILNRQIQSYGNKTHNHDRMADYVVRLEMLEEKYNELVLESEEKQLALFEAIKKLPAKHEEIITLRFIKGKSFKEIERITFYSFKSCERFVREALLMINNPGITKAEIRESCLKKKI